MTRLSRRMHIAPQVLIVDGLSGSGKAAVTPILLGLARVENVLVRYIFEYLCCAHHFGRMEDDAVDSLIRLLTDVASYDNSISREINLRPSDITCALKTHLRAQYLDRLFLPDGKAAQLRIDRERPILHLMTHQVFGMSTPIFRSLGERLTFVKTVRHPLDMLSHQVNYMERYGTDQTDFTVWIDHKGKDLPWFARGNEDLFLKSKTMDRVIYSLKWMLDQEAERLAALPKEHRDRMVILPFEAFVRDPEPYLARIESLLGTTRLPVMAEILKAQRIPREVANAGTNPEGYYSRFRFQAPEPGATNASELQKTWAWAEKEASPAALAVLRGLCEEYQKESVA